MTVVVMVATGGCDGDPPSFPRSCELRAGSATVDIGLPTGTVHAKWSSNIGAIWTGAVAVVPKVGKAEVSGGQEIAGGHYDTQIICGGGVIVTPVTTGSVDLANADPADPADTSLFFWDRAEGAAWVPGMPVTTSADWVPHGWGSGSRSAYGPTLVTAVTETSRWWLGCRRSHDQSDWPAACDTPLAQVTLDGGYWTVHGGGAR